MPDRWIDGLKTVEEDGETKYRVSLDYPEIMPFMDNAESRALAARAVHEEPEQGRRGQRRGARGSDHASAPRSRRCWATTPGRRTSSRSAWRRRASAVDAFLGDLERKLAPKVARRHGEALSAAKQAAHRRQRTSTSGTGGTTRNRLHKTEYAVDDFEVANYFPLDACIDGLFLVTQELLGIRYEPAPDAPRWHEDVQAFDIYDARSGGAQRRSRASTWICTRGRTSSATRRRSRCVGGRTLPDGTYQQPISAIVANFTKPTADAPSLLRHTEVVTFFHEFGHILHQTLTRARLPGVQRLVDGARLRRGAVADAGALGVGSRRAAPLRAPPPDRRAAARRRCSTR